MSDTDDNRSSSHHSSEPASSLEQPESLEDREDTTKTLDSDVFSFAAGTIEKVKKLLKSELWEKSFLLKHKRKKAEETLSEFEESMGDLKDRVLNVDNVVEKKRQSINVPEGDKLVYVSLYQASGKDIMMWQITCNAIATCGFGRPIYLEEEMAQQWVKSKGAGNTDGYAVVHVPESSIILLDKDERPMYDGLENQIVHIKPGNLAPESIVKFVHYNQDSYYFIDGKLVLSE